MVSLWFAHIVVDGVIAGIWVGVILIGKTVRETRNAVIFIEWIKGAPQIMGRFMPAALMATFGLSFLLLALNWSTASVAACWVPMCCCCSRPEQSRASWRCRSSMRQ
jgi:hypothetical protein